MSTVAHDDEELSRLMAWVERTLEQINNDLQSDITNKETNEQVR